MIAAREACFRSLVAVLALACWAAPARAIDDAEGSQPAIDAGRLGVMMDQALQLMDLTPGEPAAGTEPFAILKAAVIDYQQVQPIACARHAAGPDVCASLFNPAWLQEPDVPAPEASLLRQRIEDASSRLMPLWNALCAKLPHESGLCQIE